MNSAALIGWGRKWERAARKTRPVSQIRADLKKIEKELSDTKKTVFLPISSAPRELRKGMEIVTNGDGSHTTNSFLARVECMHDNSIYVSGKEGAKCDHITSGTGWVIEYTGESVFAIVKNKRQIPKMLLDCSASTTRLVERRDKVNQEMARARMKSQAESTAKLLVHSKIANIGINKGKLRVVTRPISIEGTYIGCFMFHLDPAYPERRYISIGNIDGKIDDYDHPHILSGSPCWGTWGRAIDNSILSGNAYFLVDAIICFLESYNNGAFVHVDAWAKS